jgi:hypothetical protein
LGFTTRGTPHSGLNFCLFKLSSYAQSAHRPILAPGHKAIRLPPDSTRRPGCRLTLERISHVNIIIFTSYHGHPYPRTDNAFNVNQEITEPPCQTGVMSGYSLYDSIGRWVTMRQDWSSTSWHLNEVSVR